MDVSAQDHPAAALAAVIGSWLAWLSTMLVQVEPVLRVLSLTLAIVASSYAILFYRKKLKS